MSQAIELPVNDDDWEYLEEQARDNAEFMQDQDVSGQQLAGEQFQDTFDMYANEY
jgi:hypothetical protein